MNIKKLYFGVFLWNNEYFNHLLQKENGTWCFAHIPKARPIADTDTVNIPEEQACRYAAHGIEFSRRTVEHNYKQAGFIMA